LHVLGQTIVWFHSSVCWCLQAQAFASWKDLVAYRHAKHGAMADSVRRILQGSLGRAFAAWSSRVHEQAALKLKAAQCLARLTHAHAASAFTAWVDWAAEQKEHRLALVPYLPQSTQLELLQHWRMVRHVDQWYQVTL